MNRTDIPILDWTSQDDGGACWRSDWNNDFRWVYQDNRSDEFRAEITCFTNGPRAPLYGTTMKYRIVRTADRQFKWFAGAILQGFTTTATAAHIAANEHARKWYLWILSKEQQPGSRHYCPA